MAKNDIGRLSRRDLMQAAGGLTFFALSPSAIAESFGHLPSVDVSPFGSGPMPVFSAMPYLQAGAHGARLKDGEESMVVAWQTNNVPATFALSYGESGFTHEVAVNMAIPQGQGGDQGYRTNYFAELTGLKLNRKYRYRVTMNGARLLEGFFTTRKPRGTPTRFIAFGDNSHGDVSDKAIAFQAYRAKGDFVMNTGDIVYDSGLDNEYVRFFFGVYNADEAGLRIGAPLMRSVPVYTVLGNHDINKDSADFHQDPDSLGYYTNLHFPQNGPVPANPTPIVGPDDVLSKFREVAGGRYPTQANYTFDYGDAHFVCLDSSTYVDPTDASLQAWVEKELSETDAPWKIVVCHHPPFNAGHKHFHEQHMRVLAPIFERHGVHLVLSGHEHTYQRTRPLKFEPRDISKAHNVGSEDRFVPGRFTVDRLFDGVAQTKSDGVIYLTTGAGGKYMYDLEQNRAASTWTHPEDDHADYVANIITDRHSLTVFDMDSKSLLMRQVDEWGTEIDRMRIDL